MRVFPFITTPTQGAKTEAPFLSRTGSAEGGFCLLLTRGFFGRTRFT